MHKAFSPVVFASRSTLTCRPTHELPCKKHFATSPASTIQTKGLPNIIWTDITKSRLNAVDIEAAKFAFQKSNPFNDPEAENCRLSFFSFERPRDYADGNLDERRAAWIKLYHEAALVLHEVLNKTVPAASDSMISPWPLVIAPSTIALPTTDSSSAMTPRRHISFKLPSSQDPWEFGRELGAVRLDRGTVKSPKSAETWKAAEEWWYRLLFLLPQEQRYWEMYNSGWRGP